MNLASTTNRSQIYKKGTVTQVATLNSQINSRLWSVFPEDFIAIVEQAYFIKKITSWIINRAIDEATRFREANINVSLPLTFRQKRLRPYYSAEGVEIAIDDFGISYQSMAQLQNLQVSTIQVDSSFVFNL